MLNTVDLALNNNQSILRWLAIIIVWFIVSCLTFIDKYFVHIQYKKFNKTQRDI